MSNQRTKTRFVPKPVAPPQPNPSAIDNSEEEARRSPGFREALRKDDEREAEASFRPDRDLWGRTGAGPQVPQTEPKTSRRREASRAQPEDGGED
ncbi:hypothetical protein J7E62_23110 [Variovorax paradoxus]|nr:hypothetical protein [Variovorax paradoxus]